MNANVDMICRNEEILCSCVRRKWSKEVSAARGIEIGVSYTPSGKRLARLERARLACRRYSSSDMGLRLKDSLARMVDLIEEKDNRDYLPLPQERREKFVERIAIRIGQERMDFADRDKELFGLRAKSLIEFIVMREICEVFARRDLCGDIGEDDVVEERVPGERHTVKTASSSVLLLFIVEFINNVVHCRIEALHRESGVMECGADGITQVRIIHKVLTSFLTFVKYIITFFLRNVKREGC